MEQGVEFSRLYLGECFRVLVKWLELLPANSARFEIPTIIC